MIQAVASQSASERGVIYKRGQGVQAAAFLELIQSK